MAAALRNGGKSKKFTCDVISYSTTASQSARSVENLLQCLVRCLRKMSGTEEDSSIPQSYEYIVFQILKTHLYVSCVCTHQLLLFLSFDNRNLLSEFHSSLSDRKKTPMVLLVDGVDLVEDGRGQLNSDWIPQQLPQVSYRQENTHQRLYVKIFLVYTIYDARKRKPIQIQVFPPLEYSMLHTL